MPVPQIQELDNHTFMVQAQTDLDDVNQALGIELPIVDDYQTLGGFLLFHLQKLPLQDEVYQLYDLEITIVSTDGPRLDLIRVHKLELGSSTYSEPDHQPSSISDGG